MKQNNSAAEDARPSGKMRFDYFHGRQADQYAFIMLPRVLISDERFEGLRIEAKVLYSLMLDRASMSARNGWVDKDNKVYIVYPVEKVADDMGCRKDKAIELIKSLTDFGLIEKKRMGQGKATRFYVMDFATGLEDEHPEREDDRPGPEAIFNELRKEQNTPGCSASSPGAAAGGCVSRASVAHQPEVGFSDFKKSEKPTSETRKNRLQEVGKTDSNYTNNNYTDLNYTNPSIVSLRKVDGCDEMRTSDNPISISPEEKREACMDALKDQVEYTVLTSDQKTDTDRLDEILGLMTDVLCSAKKTIRISGEDMPVEVVKSRLMKVGYFEMQYILDSLANPARRIRNIRAYMLAAIYNAPITMNSHFAAEVSADMAEDGGRDSPESGRRSAFAINTPESREETDYAV